MAFQQLNLHSKFGRTKFIRAREPFELSIILIYALSSFWISVTVIITSVLSLAKIRLL